MPEDSVPGSAEAIREIAEKIMGWGCAASIPDGQIIFAYPDDGPAIRAFDPYTNPAHSMLSGVSG
jgi:hypothetical protein